MKSPKGQPTSAPTSSSVAAVKDEASGCIWTHTMCSITVSSERFVLKPLLPLFDQITIHITNTHAFWN